MRSGYQHEDTYECTGECGWQGSRNDTDAGHCPECGAECMDLESIYGPDGISPDPEWMSGTPPAAES